MGRTTHDFLHDTQSISNSSFTPQPPHHQASKATFSALLDGNVLVGLHILQSCGKSRCRPEHRMHTTRVMWC